MENHVPITADLWYLYLGVLLFEWVLILEKSVAIASMGTYICGVLVFDGYLYSREYSISSHMHLAHMHTLYMYICTLHTCLTCTLSMAMQLTLSIIHYTVGLQE